MTPIRVAEQLSLDQFPSGRLSVAVYGPGTGEGVLFRLPGGEWGVVDGCAMDGEGGLNPIRVLLDAAGVSRLHFCAMTHPHEDHLLGLDQIIGRFKPKHLWWAGETHDRMFSHYLRDLRATPGARAHDEVDPRDPAPIDTVQRVSRAVARSLDRKEGDRRAIGAALSDEKLLYEWEDDGGRGEIWGVLPTTGSVRQTLRRARAEPLPDDVEDRHGEVNEASGALLIRWGRAGVLLAGDALKGTVDGHRGWSWWRARRDHDEVQVVNVAHHASSGAHDDELWAMLRPRLALVTPFKRSAGRNPPQPEMLRKLLASGAEVGLTARPQWWETADHGLRGFTEASAPVPATGIPGRAPRAIRARGGAVGAIAASLRSTGEIDAITLAGGAALLQAV